MGQRLTCSRRLSDIKGPAGQSVRRAYDTSLHSVPLSLGVPPKPLGKLWVPLAAADRALDQIDPPAQNRPRAVP